MNRIFLFIVTIIFLAGCASNGVGRSLTLKNAGKEKIVERSDRKRPGWAIEKPMWVKKGVLYSSGMFTDAPNLSRGLAIANKNARANIVDSMREHLQHTFTAASEGLGIDQMEVQEMTFSSSEAIASGFFINQHYYEKKQVRGPTGITYKYDCFALSEITEANYLKALDGVLNGYQKKGISKEFREKVNKREEEFFQKDSILSNLAQPTKEASEENP